MPVAQFLAAWQRSIETAQTVSPAGGYIVSRHFYRLAEHRASSVEDSARERQKLEAFLATETRRQKTLSAGQPDGQLDLWTDLLQFCDLLSLYICCGATENVIFPKYFGIEVRLANGDDGLKLAP